MDKQGIQYRKDDMIVLMLDEFEKLKQFETLEYFKNMAIRIGVEFDYGRYLPNREGLKIALKSNNDPSYHGEAKHDLS